MEYNYKLEPDFGSLGKIVYSPDEKLIFASNKEETYAWDATTFTFKYKVPGQIRATSFSADSRYFLTEQNIVLRLIWMIETATGEIIKKIDLRTFEGVPSGGYAVSPLAFRAKSYEIILGFRPIYRNSNPDDRYEAMAYTREMRQNIPLTIALIYNPFTETITRKYPKMEHRAINQSHWMIAQHSGGSGILIDLHSLGQLDTFKNYDIVTLSPDSEIGVGFLDNKPWSMHAFYMDDGSLKFKNGGGPAENKIYLIGNKLWWFSRKTGELRDIASDELISQFTDLPSTSNISISPQGNFIVYYQWKDKILHIIDIRDNSAREYPWEHDLNEFSPDERYIFFTNPQREARKSRIDVYELNRLLT